VSCDQAENSLTFDNYYEHICTVNKWTVTPEFADTSYRIENMDRFNYLSTGDRAKLVLRNYYNSEATKYPEWTIDKVVEIIPTREIVSKDQINAEEYNTLVTSINDYRIGDQMTKAIWVWNNLQNINVQYQGVEDGAQFAMTVIGVEENCVHLQLHVKAAVSGSAKSETLLTFNLLGLEDVLSQNELSTLVGYDKLQTQVWVNCLLPVTGEVKNIATPVTEFANPFKK
jgi:hypothetical protein